MAENPQPLNGEEVREGIAVRISSVLPEPLASQVKPIIFDGLGKSCSFSGVFSKFKATWKLSHWQDNGELRLNWWVDYVLDDFGHITAAGIGGRNFNIPAGTPVLSGEIPEMPPDKFRRETKQPIPSPQTPAKKEDPQRLGISHSRKSGRKQSDV